SLLFGLDEALRMLVDEEQLPNVFRRQHRVGEAVRRGITGMGLTLFCRDRTRCADTVTTIAAPLGVDVNAVLTVAQERLGLELARGIIAFSGKIFRIGHLGWINELEVLAILAGVELAFALHGAPMQLGSGVAAAQKYLLDELG